MTSFLGLLFAPSTWMSSRRAQTRVGTLTSAQVMLGRCSERSTSERLPKGCVGGGILIQAVWSNGHRSAGLGPQRPAALGLSLGLVNKNRRDALWGPICDSASPYSRQRQCLFWAIFCHLLPPDPPATTIAALGT